MYKMWTIKSCLLISWIPNSRCATLKWIYFRSAPNRRGSCTGTFFLLLRHRQLSSHQKSRGRLRRRQRRRLGKTLFIFWTTPIPPNRHEEPWSSFEVKADNSKQRLRAQILSLNLYLRSNSLEMPIKSTSIRMKNEKLELEMYVTKPFLKTLPNPTQPNLT